MGAIQSNFEFYSNSIRLDVVKQILIERATAKSDYSSLENESYGYGYAYSDWRIEFVSNTGISSRESTIFDNRRYRGQYQLILKNKDGDVLLSQYLNKSKIRGWKGKNELETIYTYSIDLYGLPVVILDDVVVVEIVLID